MYSPSISASSVYSSDDELHDNHSLNHPLNQLATVASLLFEALNLQAKKCQRTDDTLPIERVAKLVADQSHFIDGLKPMSHAFGPQSALGLLASPRRPLPSAERILDELGSHLTTTDTYSNYQTLAFVLKLLEHQPTDNLTPATALQQIHEIQQKAEIAHRVIAHAYRLDVDAGVIPVEILRQLGPAVLSMLFRLNQFGRSLNIHFDHQFDSATLATCLRNKLYLKCKLTERPVVDTPALRRAVNRELEDPETLMQVMNKLPRHPLPPGQTPQSRIFWKTHIQRGALQLERHLPEVFLNDKPLMLVALKKRGIGYLRLSEQLKRDPDIIEAALQQNGMNLEYLPEPQKSYRANVFQAVAQAGLALQYVSEQWRADEHIARVAVLNNPTAFGFASPQLRDDEGFVDSLMHVNPNCLMYASDRLKYEPIRLRHALVHDGHNLQHLDEAHQADMQLYTLAVEGKGEAIEFVPHDAFAYRALAIRSFVTTQEGFEAHMLLRIDPRLLVDRELVLAAATRSGESILFELDDFDGTAAQFNAFRLMVSNDMEILEAAVTDQGLVLYLANEELRRDPDLFEIALKDDPGVLDLAEPHVLDSEDWARRVIEDHGECFDAVVQAFTPRIRSDFELMLEAVAQSKTNYRFVEPVLRQDLDFSRRAVNANVEVFTVLSEAHQQDPRVLEIYLNNDIVQRSVDQLLIAS